MAKPARTDSSPPATDVAPPAEGAASPSAAAAPQAADASSPTADTASSPPPTTPAEPEGRLVGWLYRHRTNPGLWLLIFLFSLGLAVSTLWGVWILAARCASLKDVSTVLTPWGALTCALGSLAESPPATLILAIGGAPLAFFVWAVRDRNQAATLHYVREQLELARRQQATEARVEEVARQVERPRVADLEDRKMNLQEVECVDEDLHGIRWGDANLQKANLERVNLREADLRRAVLTGANLQGANLQNAKLTNAVLRDTNMFGANLQGVDLQGAKLYNANLGAVNLQKAQLKEAILQGIKLNGAQLQGMDLQEANLLNANLQHAQLQGVDLRGANLQGVDLIGADLQDANLQGAYLADTKIEVKWREYVGKYKVDGAPDYVQNT